MSKKVNFKPILDKVLVEVAEAEEKTKGGIIIPDAAKEKPQIGTVVATGNGKHEEEMLLKTGNKILFSKYSGTEIIIEGKEYLLIKQSEVLGIFNN